MRSLHRVEVDLVAVRRPAQAAALHPHIVGGRQRGLRHSCEAISDDGCLDLFNLPSRVEHETGVLAG
jgi:hypothetical protein